MPIELTETFAVRAAAWEIAERYALPTLYDAAFLACLEIRGAEGGSESVFWTTDHELLRSLGTKGPTYVRALETDEGSRRARRQPVRASSRGLASSAASGPIDEGRAVPVDHRGKVGGGAGGEAETQAGAAAWVAGP